MADPILIDTASMDPASALTGAELVAVVQGGSDKRTTAQDIANLAASVGFPELWIPLPQIAAEDYAVLNARNGGNLATRQVASNSSYFCPFVVGRSITLSAIAIDVTTAVAASLTDIGIYDSGANMLPAARLALASNLDSGTTGKKESAVSLVLGPGLYYCALTCSSNPSFRAVAAASSMGFGTLASPPTASMVSGIRVATGGLTDPAPSTFLLSDSGNPFALFAKFTG